MASCFLVTLEQTVDPPGLPGFRIKQLRPNWQGLPGMCPPVRAGLLPAAEWLGCIPSHGFEMPSRSSSQTQNVSLNMNMSSQLASRSSHQLSVLPSAVGKTWAWVPGLRQTCTVKALSCFAALWQWHTVARQLLKIGSVLCGSAELIPWANPYILNTHGFTGTYREGFIRQRQTPSNKPTSPSKWHKILFLSLPSVVLPSQFFFIAVHYRETIS